MAIYPQQPSADGDVQDLATDFTAGAALTDSELRSVVALATEVGIKEISLIKTTPIYPGRRHSVLVREKATEDRPFYRYRYLFLESKRLGRENWSRIEARRREKGLVLDGFMAQRINDIKFFPLVREGMTYEIQVGEFVKIADLLRVVASIESGRIAFELIEGKQPDISPRNGRWPSYVGRSYGTYGLDTHVLSYWQGGSGMDFHIYFRGETMVVVRRFFSVS
jgi:hypothetical protein